MSHILIVEDEPVIRGALRKLLVRHEHSVEEAESVEQALENNLNQFDLIISDLRLPGEPGTNLIEAAGNTPVLIMTSYASLRSAVDAMRLGAVDYIPKPFDHDEMLLAVDRVLKEGRLNRGNRALRRDLERSFPVRNMVGDSPAMQELKHRISRVAPTNTPVLIMGEAGTGKELTARALHEHSKRINGPLVSIQCAALPKNLQLTELFGDDEQPGRIEEADGGTLFLDEVGELASDVQSRLLTLLTHHEIHRQGSLSPRRVDVRILASNQLDLPNRITDGSFRQDLYYRLNVMELTLPPLRDRHEDLEPLANALLARGSEKLNRPNLHFTPQALGAMHSYSWPGNVRELENVIERAIILTEEDGIGPAQLGLNPSRPPQRVSRASLDPSEDLSLEDYFTRFVMENQDSMTETELAQKLGISRKSLWERRQRLGIPRKKSSIRR
ncbi:MAG: Fis family transcriptional regulator [Alcanivorax borkumensis]|jgi:DNA-binding NtrC family response regulator|uniref:Nitrogen regulation protein NR(I) n=2 Tax=Pseudomonadati TaxID=3379134 RepID=Q0VSQ9_ALCBS|nr:MULTISPECIES: sigma-54 dependent transcriptional regulator [Alcanivorax]OJH07942.1 MAG: Fis family transcriptional regulator [Alcanivorax borkumensis]EUC68007.1 Fis family transcriptional regulator [Alcanivorax sp. 97CO-5]PKG00429.1 sigma-54-dependent Fis family transcriptional regulator [Alcanivorax sp. 97CO-6]CAL15789.1 nitrogen regulation protein NR(I [Alcanivorax borkumensis SK2]BAP13203.1 nitrogen regulation protein NR(I) [Alcanivorax sp. NBRC 101098]